MSNSFSLQSEVLLKIFNDLDMLLFCVCESDFTVIYSNSFLKKIIHADDLTNLNLLSFIEIKSSELQNLRDDQILSFYDISIKPDCRKYKICFYKKDNKLLMVGELLNVEAGDLMSSFSRISNETNNLLRELNKKNRELEKANNKIRELTRRDPLTGVFNRRYLSEHLNRVIPLSKRKKLPLSLIMLDIDDFKNINDNHGHDIGDKVLTEITNLISYSIRSEDFLARFGGEEFILVLDYSDIIQASLIAEKIRKKIEDAEIIEGETVTASFGITQLVKDDDLFSLIKRAGRRFV